MKQIYNSRGSYSDLDSFSFNKEFNLTDLENSNFVIKSVKFYSMASVQTLKILLDSGEIQKVLMKYNDGTSGLMKSEDFHIDCENPSENIRTYFRQFYGLNVQLGTSELKLDESKKRTFVRKYKKAWTSRIGLFTIN